MNKYYIQLIARGLLVTIATLCLIGIAYIFFMYLYPFLIAFILAYLINPFVNFLTYDLKFPRALAVLLSILLLLATAVGVLTIFISEILSTINYLAIQLPTKFAGIVDAVQHYSLETIGPMYDAISNSFNKLGVSQKETIIDNIQNFSSNLIDTVRNIVSALFVLFTNFLTSFPAIITVVIITLLATFFVSNDWYRLIRLSNGILPDKIKYFSQNIFSNLRLAILGLIKAQLTFITITTLIVLIGLLILKVPYALTIAVLTGFVELIPYFGTGLIFVPWILYCYITAQYSLALGLTIVFITGIVVRQIIEPKILSSNIGLEPLPTLISLFIGVKLFGLIGLILGPLLLVFLSTLQRALVFKAVWNFITEKQNPFR